MAFWISQWAIQVHYDRARLQQDPTAENQRRFESSLAITRELVSGVGSLATIVGGIMLIFNFRLATQNFQITKDQLMTERFARAVDQLGHNDQSVRTGAVYALEKIAQEAPQEYHWTVMEILTAYLRERSPTPPQTPALGKAIATHESDTDEADPEATLKFKFSSDAQAALTTIGRRQTHLDPANQQINLVEADLSRADLYQANLSSADLYRVNFTWANLSEINCQGAFCRRANFFHARLKRADFRWAKLIRATFDQADFSGADLTGADLRGADLRGARRLTVAQVKSAENWQQALYDPDLAKELGLASKI